MHNERSTRREVAQSRVHREAFLLFVGRHGEDGIRVASSCVITRNQVSGASLAGIHVTGNGNRIEENQVSGSPTGYLVDGANGNVVVKNTARGNATPYSVPVGNFVGALVNTAAGVTSANAWANFAY